MRSLFFLTFVAESYSLCGKGPVDLGGMEPFQVSVNCPGNKDKDFIEMGCVNVRTPGQNAKLQSQKSNTFYINPCGEYKTTIEECKGKPGAGLEVTVDIKENNKDTDTNCYSLGGIPNAKFDLIGEQHTHTHTTRASVCMSHYYWVKGTGRGRGEGYYYFLSLTFTFSIHACVH